MKEIILLKKNGKVKIKDENKITNTDIEDSKWFLINVSTSELESRNYSLVKPSNLFIFDRANISYQLCLKYQDYDYYIDINEFKPVSFNTNSLSDVISIINSADKLNIVNNLLIEDMLDSTGQIALLYLGITLYRNDTVIYDQYYQLKGVETNLFESYSVTKKFNKIYDGNCMGEMLKNKEFIYFKDDNGKMCWETINTIPKSGMFGYPNNVSNSIVILYPSEYRQLMLYSNSTLFCNIIFDKIARNKLISNNIKNGEYEKALHQIDDSQDMYVNTRRVVYRYKRNFGLLLSVICNLNFIFLTIKTIYDELYDSDVQMFKDENGDIIYEFECILAIHFEVNDKHGKVLRQIMITQDSMLTPTQIFDLI